MECYKHQMGEQLERAIGTKPLLGSKLYLVQSIRTPKEFISVNAIQRSLTPKALFTKCRFLKPRPHHSLA